MLRISRTGNASGLLHALQILPRYCTEWRTQVYFWESYFFKISTYRWGTLSSHFTVNVFKITCYMRTQGAISYPAAATFSVQHFVVPEVSEKGAKNCREDENVISNFWESFSHVFWLWIPRGFYFSSNIVFLWPLLNVNVLIIHTNVQFSFGSYWIPAGHQLWLIISWVTAEYAQMLVVRTVWPLASSTAMFHSFF